MGIHFVCHHCSYALHVKDFQAGKRGKCPSCKGSFRIPMGDASYSSPLEESSSHAAVLQLKQAFQSITAPSKPDAPSKADAPRKPELDSDSSDSIAIALETQPDTDSSSSSNKPTENRELHQTNPLPKALAEAADFKWFVRPPSGGQFGPAPSPLLLNWVAESRITSDSLLWREGLEQWQLASELLPELFSSPNAELPLPPTVSAPPELDLSAPSLLGEAASTETAVSDSSAARAAAIMRKRMQKRRQQMTMVMVLAAISFVLLCILIYVLVFQAGPPQAPA